MSTTPPLPASIPADTPNVAGEPSRPSLRDLRTRAWPRLGLHHLALLGVLALSAVLNVRRLSQNGYANVFYSAGVKAMLVSLHNFLFVSFDPGGMITVDKPPLGMWLQALSAKLFGFSALSLLLPEAIAGVLAVAALYWALVRPFGRLAAVGGALALAVFPSFVAVSRDNNMDALLILLMVLACGVGIRAVGSGRWRTLLGCAVLIGLAFETKTLAAYLVLPPIGLAYLVCAPGTVQRRLLQLLVAGAVMLAVSFAWIAFVELTPSSHRPFIGGSTDNTELGLTFEYNGFGRVGGQVGGPGRVPVVRPGTHPAAAATPALPRPAPPTPSLTLPNGRLRHPTAFGGATGPLRLFGTGLGDQGAWMLPFALLGLVGVGALIFTTRRDPVRHDSVRRDPRLGGLLLFGGWLLVEAAVLSFSKGIVHPYYVSALGPGVAAMTGAGTGAFTELARRRSPGLVLFVLGVGATVATQVILLNRVSYMHWFLPLLIAAAAVGVLAVAATALLERFSGVALAAVLGVLLVAPTAYAATTWLAPVQGTFPAAGPRQATGYGGLGVSAASLRSNRDLMRYTSTHGPGSRWALLTDASDTAAPLILMGLKAGAVGGYSGVDPALDGPALARLVSRGEARYVVLGGAYADRGGNRATAAVRLACRRLSPRVWEAHYYTQYSLVLYDCRGRAPQLAAR